MSLNEFSENWTDILDNRHFLIELLINFRIR